MNAKRTLSLMLCVCLLLLVLTAFSACGGKSKTLDLTDYTVVYDADFEAGFKWQVTALTKRITAHTGLKLSSVSAKREEGEKEILIGATGRAATEKLLAEISGHGYAFAVVEDKLVIVGTTKLLTVKAMQVFADACLLDEGDSSVTVPKTVVSDVDMLTVSPDFAVVYSALLNDQPAPEGGAANDGPDYAFEMAEKVQKGLRETLSAKSKFALAKDSKTANKEVLVGLVERDAVGTFLQDMDVNDYGFGVVEGRVVITGLNGAGLGSAVDLFLEAVKADTADDGGTKSLQIPADFKWISTKSSGAVTDFPRPTGADIALTGSVDAGEGSMLYHYTGKGVNADAYRAYLTSLAGAGYALVQKNEIEGSLFATYQSAEKNQLLYVSYMAFAHAKSQKVETYDPAIRIVAAKATGSGNVFDDGLLTPHYDYVKVTDTRVTSLRFNYAAASGMCYVVQLEDGSFVVLDGGYKAGQDYTRLYKVLEDLHKQAFGRAPSAAEPIVITAWYLTHGHGDHYQNFVELCKAYGSKIELKYLIGNNLSDEQAYNSHDPNHTIRNTMHTVFGYTKGETKYLKVHAGQKLYLCNMELEVLFAPEDIYPLTIDVFNTASVVTRSTFTATDGSGNAVGERTTLLWLGDQMTRGSEYLRAMYGEGLKSDIVQAAHHGLSAVEIALYILVEPEIVLWPNSLARLTDVVSNTNASGYKRVSAILYQNLDSVKYHIFADTYNTTVTITGDGPDMTLGGDTGLYNAGESAPIVITEGTKDISAVVKK